jgi:hypothetical protein
METGTARDGVLWYQWPKCQILLFGSQYRNRMSDALLLCVSNRRAVVSDAARQCATFSKGLQHASPLHSSEESGHIWRPRRYFRAERA